MGVTFAHELITPQRAKRLLARNAENNRVPKKSRIPQYARDMLTGHWDPNTGETIKLDTEGVLIDGQNRMRAVVMAGEQDPGFRGVHFSMAYDVPRAAMTVIDSGSARTASDVLQIAGAANRTITTAIVRWVMLWETGAHTSNSSMFRPTNSEIAERFQAESGLFDAAARRGKDCQQAGLGNGSAAGVARYLFGQIDVSEASAFFDQYVSGANLPPKSPVLALRNRMARVKMDRITRAEQLALFVRAWNAYRAGTTLDRMLITRSGELTNDNFPMPK